MILERGLSVLVWILLMVPAAGLTVLLPYAVREAGGIITVIIAIMLAGAVRNAFVKPIFLIMMMIRFHTLIEGQPINASWNDYLASISDKFRDLGRGASAATA